LFDIISICRGNAVKNNSLTELALTQLREVFLASFASFCSCSWLVYSHISLRVLLVFSKTGENFFNARNALFTHNLFERSKF
jgi:hypothetical protein